ncbi:ATP-binding protein [Patescibacteria group bacterium]|nr:ATP-binding protein [Patescibacteria group bacterium]MCG2702594.1 ATP-binding protein [Candidatus Parcubacteria bacterium]MBU4265512.1 ATP-binding protein [Patescibacteria group bacterium]MBU4390562.1 ATP-binding protein [Patescibacteria group bacterium]MBU4396904.1 ATP-binding protein [Patescibacteria group bacterium]
MKSAVAFANSDGGIILIGTTDNKKYLLNKHSCQTRAKNAKINYEPI